MSNELTVREGLNKVLRLLDHALGDSDPNIPEFEDFEESGLSKEEFEAQNEQENPVFYAHLILSEALAAEQQVEPVAWSYEIATQIKVSTNINRGNEYKGWENRTTKHKPCVPEGSIRNLIPLFTHPAPLRELSDDEIDEIWVNVLTNRDGSLKHEQFAKALLSAARGK